jgi:hypothetical protein
MAGTAQPKKAIGRSKASQRRPNIHASVRRRLRGDNDVAALLGLATGLACVAGRMLTLLLRQRTANRNRGGSRSASDVIAIKGRRTRPPPNYSLPDRLKAMSRP